MTWSTTEYVIAYACDPRLRALARFFRGRLTDRGYVFTSSRGRKCEALYMAGWRVDASTRHFVSPEGRRLRQHDALRACAVEEVAP